MPPDEGADDMGGPVLMALGFGREGEREARERVLGHKHRASHSPCRVLGECVLSRSCSRTSESGARQLGPPNATATANGGGPYSGRDCVKSLHSGRDCVKPLWPSYTGLYAQTDGGGGGRACREALGQLGQDEPAAG